MKLDKLVGERFREDVYKRQVGDDTSAAIVLTVRGIVSFRSTQTVLADVQCTSPLVRDLSLIHIFIFKYEGNGMFSQSMDVDLPNLSLIHI